MQLPNRIPVMVLPNAVLFPQSILPLYIFEKRYREMLQQALDNQRVFALALAQKNGEPHPVAGLGLVRACVDHPNGSSHLLLQGMARVRLKNYIQEEPYRLAEVEVFKTLRGETKMQADALALKLIESVEQHEEIADPGRHDVTPFLRQLEDPESIGDLIAAHFIEDVSAKQELLAIANLVARLHRLAEMLA